MTATKTARQVELSQQTTSHDRERDALISRHGTEKAKMKEAWRAVLQPEREQLKSTDKPKRGRDAEGQPRGRKRQPRDREAGRRR